MDILSLHFPLRSAVDNIHIGELVDSLSYRFSRTSSVSVSRRFRSHTVPHRVITLCSHVRSQRLPMTKESLLQRTDPVQVSTIHCYRLHCTSYQSEECFIWLDEMYAVFTSVLIKLTFNSDGIQYTSARLYLQSWIYLPRYFHARLNRFSIPNSFDLLQFSI